LPEFASQPARRLRGGSQEAGQSFGDPREAISTPCRDLAAVNEVDRLHREMANARTPAEALRVLEQATLQVMPQIERLRIADAMPEHLKGAMRRPDGLSDLIPALQHFDVWCGFASKWRQRYPWPDSPWQMIFATAARTAQALASIVPEGDRPALAYAIRETAQGRCPLTRCGTCPPCVAKATTCAQNPAVGSEEVGLLMVRVLRTAWQTHRGLGDAEPEIVLYEIIATSFPLGAEPPLRQQYLDVAKSMRALARASPVAVGPKLLNNPNAVVRAASCEAMTFLVGRTHHDNPMEAQGWLGALLAVP
jgi:hypothetical protein